MYGVFKLDAFLLTEDDTEFASGIAFQGMIKYSDTNKGVAGAIVLMFIAGMGIAWVAYSTLFPQGILTFFILLAYIPITGIIALFLYLKLRWKN